MKHALHLGLVTCFLMFAGIRCEHAATVDQPSEEVGSSEQSVIVAPPAATAAQSGAKVAVGYYSTCAVLGNNSALKCWGDGFALSPTGLTLGDQAGEMGDSLPLVDLTPYEVPKINEVAVGPHTACVTRADANNNYITQCWGYNGSGQLGLGDTVTRTSPVKVPAVPLPGYRVAVGYDFVCRMPGNDTDGPIGTVYCLGSNANGQLGYGDTNDRGDQPSELGAAERPVDLGTGRRAKRVVAGSQHVCALLDNDKVKCWGSNSHGELGIGDTEARGDAPNELGDALPTVDLGTGRYATEISAGEGFSCARLDNGFVKCWGIEHALGTGKGTNFGDGSSADAALGDNPLWTGVRALGSKSLTSGAAHTCLTNSPGTGITCWGLNVFGELGLGDTKRRGDDAADFGSVATTTLLNNYKPLVGTLYGANAKVESIVAGGYSTCAVISGGSTYRQLKCWGFNGFGLLGLGNKANRGDNANEMGDSLPKVNTGSRSVAWLEDPTKPFQDSPIAAGDVHTCAILSTAPNQTSGPVKCWGHNGQGRLGLGDTNTRGDAIGEMSDALPFVDLGSGRTAKHLAVGGAHTCVILDDDTVKCWGANNFGQLGYGDTTSRGTAGDQMGIHLPTVQLGNGRKAVKITAGSAHTCALLDNSTIKCWGANYAGQLGRGNTTDIGSIAGQMDTLTPIDFGTTESIVDVKSGDDHVCAVFSRASGYGIKCWGQNWAGQLGLGDSNARGDEPGEMAALPFLQINGDMLALGGWHTCAGQSGPNGFVKCWGYNVSGQLGLGDTTTRGDQSTPTRQTVDTIPALPSLGMTVQKLWAGGPVSCALGIDAGTDGSNAGQRVKCWGDNISGVLGVGDGNNLGDNPGEVGVVLPYIDLGLNRAIGITSVTVARADSYHACAVVQATGQVKCWGSSSFGQLGLGDTVIRGYSQSDMGNALPFVNLGSDPNETTDHCPNQDDNNPCTTDTCNPATNTVTHTAVSGNSCNDSNACTTGDTCSAGVCVGTAVPASIIDDGNVCTIDSCDAVAGIKHIPVTSIDDGNACTVDSCDAVAGIKHSPANAGTACNDNNVCTVNDVCTLVGTCSGSAVVLPAASPCAYSVCTASGGIMTVNAAANTACNADSSLCTEYAANTVEPMMNDRCDGSGQCVAGAMAPVNPDNRECTSDSCDPATGRPAYVPLAKDTHCGASGSTTVCDGAGRCAASLGAVLPSPADIAPALNTVGVGTIAARTEFLYNPPTGQEAIQKKFVADPTPFVFDAKRVSAIQGRVLAEDSLPLANVWVTILGHEKEYGYTKTRVDGKYDLVVEGGGWLTVNFALTSQSGNVNYFPSQRKVRVDWDDSAFLDDVVMVKADMSTAKTIEMGGAEMQIHLGSVTPTDSQTGKRGTVLLFPAGLQAQVGSSITSPGPVSELSVATTEYTRDIQTGEGTALPLRDERGSGVLAMPGELPPASGYTYAVDLFDSGSLTDTTRNVQFTGGALPIMYVDNFIGFPVGATVPVGSYDRAKGAWKAETSGLVVKIASVNANTGIVVLDYGTGTAPSDVTNDELKALYKLTIGVAPYNKRFDVGDSLWRVRTGHFSPWDCNWPKTPLSCASGGACPDDDPGTVENQDSDKKDKSPCKPGSIILCESRVLGETIPIAGTEWHLAYTSERAPGYKESRQISVQLPSGNRVKSPNRWVSAQVLTGTSYADYEAANSTLDVPVPRDEAGRVINGTVPVETVITEHFPAVYQIGGIFAQVGSGPLAAEVPVKGRSETTVSRSYKNTIVNFDAKTAGFGGWDLSVHHWLDRQGGWVFRGDGTRQKVVPQTYLVERAIPGTGSGTTGTPLDGSNWKVLQTGYDMVGAPNGDLFIATTGRRIYQVSQNIGCSQSGDTGPCIRRIAGGGSSAPTDGAPASSVRIDGSLKQMAVAPDGSLYAAWKFGIFHLYEDKNAAEWKIERVTGTAQEPSDTNYLIFGFVPIAGIGSRAADATSVGTISGLAVGGDGTLHFVTSSQFTDSSGTKVLRNVLLQIDTTGVLRQVIGGGTVPFSGVGVLPRDAYELQSLGDPVYFRPRLASAPNGDLHFSNNQAVMVLSGDGRLQAITKGEASSTSAPGEGVLSTNPLTLNAGMSDIKVSASGKVVFGDRQLVGVRQIDEKGTISTIAGAPQGVALPAPPKVGEPAVSAQSVRLPGAPEQIILMPNGDIYIGAFGEPKSIDSDSGSGPIFRLFLPRDHLSGADCLMAVPSTDGSELYCFEHSGRHKDTRDARTCVSKNPASCVKKYSFEYGSDPSNNTVLSITDSAGNTTRIDRGTADQISVVPPIGGPSTLATDSESGYLKSVIDPDGGIWSVTMSADGLLRELEDPRGEYHHAFAYDQRGKLVTDGLVNNTTAQIEALQTLEPVTGVDGEVRRNANGTTAVQSAVVHTSAEGLETKYALTSSSGGTSTRVKTELATDLSETTVERSDGTTEITKPDGTVLTISTVPDGLFGTAAPLKSTITKFPGSGSRLFITQQLHSIGTDVSSVLTTAYGPTIGTLRNVTQTWQRSENTTVTRTSAGRVYSATQDPQGRITAVRDGVFLPTEFHYTSAQGAMSQAIARGFHTDFEYSASGATNGYLATTTAPAMLNSATTFVRNGLGLVTTQSTSGTGLQAPIVTGFGWDEVGNMTSLTPPDRNAHVQTFTGFSQLATYDAPAMTSVASNATSFVYDGDKNLRRVTRPGRTPIEYVNSVGRLDYVLVGALKAGSTAVDLEYYSTETTAGASRGHVKSITGLGPLTAVPPAPASFATTVPKLTYTYEGSLPLSEGYSGPIAGAVSNTYDGYLNVATQTVTASGVTSAVTYATDADGIVTGTTGPGASIGLSADYDSNQNLRLTVVSVGATTESLTYDDYGVAASIDYVHGGSMLFKAKYHKPRTEQTADPAAERDALGRMSKVKETWSDGTSHAYAYSYDAAGRLTKVTENGTNVVESYSYDANGNRVDVSAGDTGTSYDAQDRLISYAQSVGVGSVKLWSMAYTDDGALSNLTDITTGLSTRYTYDELGNLIKVVLSDGTVLDYIIDGLGRRIGKKRNGTLERGWLYDGQLRIVAELDGSGNFASRFVYGTHPTVPDYMLKYSAGVVTGVYRVVSDHVGSPRMVINVDAAKPTDKLLDVSYSAFGIPKLASGSLSAIPFGFAAGLYDADTGLVRFGARDYDARFGRWTSKDPILFDGEQGNLYVYVANDPLNSVDPSGLVGCPEEKKACFSRCMDRQGAEEVLDAMGLGSPFASLVPKFGRDAAVGARMGATSVSSVASWATRGLKAMGAREAGLALRAVGRRLNPVANALLVGGATYMGTSAGICAIECSGR